MIGVPMKLNLPFRALGIGGAGLSGIKTRHSWLQGPLNSVFKLTLPMGEKLYLG